VNGADTDLQEVRLSTVWGVELMKILLRDGILMKTLLAKVHSHFNNNENHYPHRGRSDSEQKENFLIILVIPYAKFKSLELQMKQAILQEALREPLI
jgi:hypothetical protein